MNIKSLALILAFIFLSVVAAVIIGGFNGNGSLNNISSPTSMPMRPVPSADGGSQQTSKEFIVMLVSLEGTIEGTEFGCGDTLVAIGRESSDFDNNIELAIEELTRIDQQTTIDEDQLYNSLHNSSLEVESTEITDSKVSVRLNGQLELGGVCDNPRIEQQLTSTILSNTTATEVEIFLNGEPLAEALSLQ